MTLEEFKEKYNEAPYMEYEFAEGMSDVTDCEELREAGKGYLRAMNNLHATLEKFDVEVG